MSPRYFTIALRVRKVVTYTSPAFDAANNAASSRRRLASTGPWLVTASMSRSQRLSFRCTTTSGIFPCESIVTPTAFSASLSNTANFSPASPT